VSRDRTKAERRVDALSAELRALRAKESTKERRARIFKLERKLEAAWRVVNQMREGVR